MESGGEEGGGGMTSSPGLVAIAWSMVIAPYIREIFYAVSFFLA